MKKIFTYFFLLFPLVTIPFLLVPKYAFALVESTDNQQQTNTENESENLTIYLNERFTRNNSSTTRIDNMNQNQLREVNQFTLEEINKNKVQFKNIFDFSSKECIEKLNKLSQYADLSIVGKVTIDTDYLDMLEGEASITMYNLPYETTPLIYKDGILVTNEEVSNITYVYSISEKSGTLTFTVKDFSTYEAKENEKNAYYELNDSIEESVNPLTRILLMIGLITAQGIVVAVVVKLIEQKRLRKYNAEKDKRPEPRL